MKKIIKNYLIKNPKLIKSTLEEYKKTVEINKKNDAITLLQNIKNPGIFNKNSDITVYEFFDYNCGYCKSVVNTIMDVISEDKKVDFVVSRAVTSMNKFVPLVENNFKTKNINKIRKDGLTVLVVEQNVRMALLLADYGYVIKDGVINVEGESKKLMYDESVKDSYLGGGGTTANV